MDNKDDHTPDESSAQPGPRVSAGALIREAREAAGIPAAKVCSDLRISPATLEALEAGEYDKLAGAPYVRAMLVSLSRHLRLDSARILKAYADEVGDKPDEIVQVSPYKDDSGTHAKAHKQIFILILAVLLFILLLIMGKVNTAAPGPEPEPAAAPADTLLNLDPGYESDPLLVDTVSTDSLPAAADTATTAAAAPMDEEPEEETPETRVTLEAVLDSVWIRILPAGEREISMYLYRGKPVDYNHADAVTFITRQGRTVRVTVGDRSFVPPRRRFKVDGAQVDD